MAISATADETQRSEEENGSAVRPAAATAGPAAAFKEAEPVTGDELHQVRFSALENIAYHAAREQFLARAAKLLTGLQVLLGTGAVAMLSQALPGSAPLTMVLAALAGVIMLVTDPAAAAREHRIFRARYHGLVAEIDETGPDEITAGRARAQISRISADEPPVYRRHQCALPRARGQGPALPDRRAPAAVRARPADARDNVFHRYSLSFRRDDDRRRRRRSRRPWRAGPPGRCGSRAAGRASRNW